MGELSNLFKEKTSKKQACKSLLLEGQAKQDLVSNWILISFSRSQDQAVFFFRLVNKIPAGKAKRKPDVRLPSLILIVLMAVCVIIVVFVYFPCST